MTTTTSEAYLEQDPRDPDQTPDDQAEQSAAQAKLIAELNALSKATTQPDPTPTRIVEDTGVPPNDSTLPAVAPIDEKIARLHEEIDRTSNSALARYRQRLKDNDISQTLARDVVDSMLVQLKTYRREYTLLKGKVTITLRTRSPGDQRKINLELERENHTLNDTHRAHASLLHTAFALVSYKSQSKEYVFDHDTSDEDGWKKAMAFLQNIPGTTLAAIQNKVYEFETMISVVMSEGYEENF